MICEQCKSPLAQTLIYPEPTFVGYGEDNQTETFNQPPPYAIEECPKCDPS